MTEKVLIALLWSGSCQVMTVEATFNGIDEIGQASQIKFNGCEKLCTVG